MTRYLVLSVFFTCTFTTLAHSHAEHLIGVSWDGGIYRFDSSSGNASLLKQTSYNFNSLAKEKSGRLLTVHPYGSVLGSGNRLIAIDPLSGETTLLGDLAIPTDNRSKAGDVNALAMSPDGVLFGTFTYVYLNRRYSDLITIDPIKLTAQKIGPIRPDIFGLGFSPSGDLFAATVAHPGHLGGLLTLNPTTLAYEQIIEDTSFASAAIAFAPDGRLYFNTGRLSRIDLDTGVAFAFGGSSVIPIRGLEFVVPEPSTLAMPSSALVALAALRRRK